MDMREDEFINNEGSDVAETTEERRMSDVIVGRNPVAEVLRSGREIDKLFVAHGAANGSVKALIAKCRDKGIPVKEVSPQKLDFMSGGAVHQGVAVVVAAHKYCSLDDILQYAAERHEPPFIIICDGLEDPHNLGAVIRTAEACGVHGVVIPERRSASLNAVVAKASAGALEYMRVARVTNINAALNKLKENGVWLYAADMDGECWCTTDMTGGCGLVIGSEGRGVSRLVKENCDKTVSLPMSGHINSLNASVAAGVLMYEIARQRGNIKAKN
ncbi:MAG: 23S rRNA (guanosine(2251)-2'-O)-methyltransferase RlmB [Acutalibacteraceae bacterium]